MTRPKDLFQSNKICIEHRMLWILNNSIIFEREICKKFLLKAVPMPGLGAHKAWNQVSNSQGFLSIYSCYWVQFPKPGPGAQDEPCLGFLSQSLPFSVMPLCLGHSNDRGEQPVLLLPPAHREKCCSLLPTVTSVHPWEGEHRVCDSVSAGSTGLGLPYSHPRPVSHFSMTEPWSLLSVTQFL